MRIQIAAKREQGALSAIESLIEHFGAVVTNTSGTKTEVRCTTVIERENLEPIQKMAAAARMNVYDAS